MKMIVASIVILFLMVFLKDCSSSSVTKTKIITKEVKGNFKAVKPVQIVVHDTIEIPSNLQGQVNELILENKALQQFYNEASDSLKTALYAKEIEIKSFNHKFDNDTITATIYGLVRGEIQSIELEYKIKPTTIDIKKQKETFFRLIGGGGLGVNKELNQISYNYGVGLQNNKGNIIIFDFQKIGSQNAYSVKYLFSVWNYKK